MSRILIVEDDKDSADALATFLHMAGHHVICAPSGHEALGQIMTSTPDLVVLDLSMPHVDGTQVLEVLRSYLRLQELPVVVWTGLSQNPLVDRAMGLNVSSVITKGKADFSEILSAISRALSNQVH